MEHQDYEKLHPDARKCMRLTTAIWTGILILAEAAVVLIVGLGDMSVWLWIALGAVTALLLANLIISPKVRYSRYRYAIDEEAIRVREGFLWISYSIVPIERLHKIELSQGPVARAFHLYTVTVTTAGGEVDIKFLKEDAANEIAEHLKAVINQMAAEERTQP